MNVFKTLITISVLALTISCKKDAPAPTPITGDSRNVKYEITGNAVGTFDSTYITGSNTGATATPTSLPWVKEIVAQADVSGVLMNASVFGVTTGKTITAKIYVGGVEKKSQTETVGVNGTAIIGGLAYTFK